VLSKVESSNSTSFLRKVCQKNLYPSSVRLYGKNRTFIFLLLYKINVRCAIRVQFRVIRMKIETAQPAAVQEGYSSDTTSSDTSWVPTVIIFAHPFGNCWLPLCFWDLFFPQLSFFVLPLYVLFHPIFMARLSVPPLLIAGLHSALPNLRHYFSQ
jgi:hypothetical protein